MAHGACSLCGCALEECIRDQLCPGEIGRFMRPKPKPTSTPKVPTWLMRGDWVRVRKGHHLAGAAGSIMSISSAPVQLVTIRQLNGNTIRLPIGLVEFVSYSREEVDVL